MEKTFAERVIGWQQKQGRHHLPWQNTKDPYRIWVSEIMLQQTQVETVKHYYVRFLARFPTVSVLAAAHFDEVAALWAGLGYYARARNLHKAAIQIMTDYQGVFPHLPAELEKLAGIGRSTAAAIAAFAYGKKAAILDGNVKRVLCRYFAVDGVLESAQTLRQLWEIADSLLPDQQIESYTQGLMDLGALLCKRNQPECPLCPLQSDCLASQQEKTEVYPVRKKAAKKPVKASIFIVLEQHRRILLEKRPDHGIWGGLWCFPELPCDSTLSESDKLAICRQQVSESSAVFSSLPSFSHAFTHFTLLIFPVICRNIYAGSFILKENQRWFSKTDLAHVGMPKPVSDMVKKFPFIA